VLPIAEGVDLDHFGDPAPVSREVSLRPNKSTRNFHKISSADGRIGGCLYEKRCFGGEMD